MKEKDYYASIAAYCKKNWHGSFAIEIKIAKGNALPFSALLPHQEEAMLQAERSFIYKIPDAGIAKKPFDMVMVSNGDAVLILIYYRVRNAKIFLVPLRNFIKERESSLRKSLTSERAAAIGTVIDLR